MIFLYFDPGLGALLIQAIVAFVAGVVFFYKNLWYKVKSFFGMNSTKNSLEDIEKDFEEDTSKVKGNQEP